MFKRLIAVLAAVLLSVVVFPSYAMGSTADSTTQATTQSLAGRIVNNKASKIGFTAYRDFCSTSRPCSSSPTEWLSPGEEDPWADADGFFLAAGRKAAISNGVEGFVVYGGAYGRYVKLTDRPSPLKWLVYVT